MRSFLSIDSRRCAGRWKARKHDAVETLWLTYYSNIFQSGASGSARNAGGDAEEVLEEFAGDNADSVAAAGSADWVNTLMNRSTKKIAPSNGDTWMPAPVPETTSLSKVAEAAKSCTACPLYKNATQTVFGEGPKRATIMMIGEQPGDYEDVAGKPFVGPAGKVLDRALEEAGFDRAEVYVTNVVKHFKWEPRGKRRIHQKPSARDIAACRPWLEAELRLVEPKLVVCLGSTAAQTIFGPSFRVTKQRGEVLESELAGKVVATVHPSSLLRQPDEESREREYKDFVADLRVALEAAQ